MLSVTTLSKIAVAMFLGINTITDIKSRKIHTVVNILFAAAGLLLFFSQEEKDAAALVGGIAVGMYLILFAVLTKEAVGFGDGIVVMAMGTFLGGWKTVFVLMGGFLLASVFGVFHMCRKKANGKTRLPFLPFLTCSYLVYIVGDLL